MPDYDSERSPCNIPTRFEYFSLRTFSKEVDYEEDGNVSKTSPLGLGLKVLPN